MPLHLLGKKSWNVYNTANVDRVRRDEAEAKAREEAEEQRMQEEDAQRRIALLRGESPPVLSPVEEDALVVRDPDGGVDGRRQHDRKRRKLRGEDDTDRDIRYAREDFEAGARTRQRLLHAPNEDAELQDRAGNIQLFPAPDEAALRKLKKNEEAEAEKAQKRKREGDYNMHMSDAAGFFHNMGKPWYASQNSPPATDDRTALVLADVQSKDVWGNEDPRRRERERNRLSSNDPLGAMKHAQRQLKQSERDRESWKKQQAIEFEKASSERKRSRKHRHHRRHEDVDGLDGFALDASLDTKSDEHGRTPRRHREDHRSPRRSHSRSRHSDRRSHRERPRANVKHEQRAG